MGERGGEPAIKLSAWRLPLSSRRGNTASYFSRGFQSNADENAAVNILVAGGHPVSARDLKGSSFARLPVSPKDLRGSTAERGGLGTSQPGKREPLLLAGIPGL